MNIFKTKGVVIGITKRENDADIYTFFSYDFGKIRIQKKKKSREKSLDIGYIINCEVETKEELSIHRVKNIKIKSEFPYEGKDFRLIHEYLFLISLIKKMTPDGVPIQELYGVISQVHKIENISCVQIILSQLKVLEICGVLKREHQDKTIQKILKFISENTIGRILKLTGIDAETEKELVQLVSIV